MPKQRSLKKKNWFNSLLAYLYSQIHVPDSFKNFFADAFIRYTLFKSYESLEKELESTDSKQKKYQILSAINSKNVAIASMGLGFGYFGINISQFAAALGWGGLIWGGILIPIGLYLWASRLQSRALFLKNLAYEESKAKYDNEIEILKKNIFDKSSTQFIAKRTFLISKAIIKKITKHAETLVQFYSYIENEIQKKIEDTIAKADQKFERRYAKLISYYKMQRYLEPVKKFTRALMLFTAIFALEAANLMFSGFIIPSVFAATLLAILDFKTKEMEHDLKLKRKHEQLIALRKLEIELGGKNYLLNDLQVTPTKSAEITATPSIYKYIDYFLAGIGLTSAYVAISFVTVFNFHEMSMFKGQPLFNIGLGGLTFADALLFGGAGVVALGIAIWTIFETRKLYQFYEAEKLRLNKENNTLTQENNYLVNQRGCQLSKTRSISMSGSLKSLTDDGKKDLDISEGIKKTVRVLVYLLIFLGTSGGLVVTPFVWAMIAFAVLVGIFDYMVRRNKSKIEDDINVLKTNQLSLLNEKKQLLASYKPENDKIAKENNATKPQLQSSPKLTPAISNNTKILEQHETGNSSHSSSPTTDLIRATMQPPAANTYDPVTTSTPSLSKPANNSTLRRWEITKLGLTTPFSIKPKPEKTSNTDALDLASSLKTRQATY